MRVARSVGSEKGGGLTLTLIGMMFPSGVLAPGPTATTVPSLTCSAAAGPQRNGIREHAARGGAD